MRFSIAASVGSACEAKFTSMTTTHRRAWVARHDVGHTDFTPGDYCTACSEVHSNQRPISNRTRSGQQ